VRIIGATGITGCGCRSNRASARSLRGRAAALVHRHPVPLTPPLNGQMGIDFGPISFEDGVQFIIAGAAAVSLADVDDTFPLVGQHCAGADVLAVRRPG